MNTDENQKLWINKIHENLTLRWCSENTFINYKCALNNFFTYYDSNTDITLLSEQDIIPYLNDCFIKPNKSKYTYNVAVASIKLLYIVCFNKRFDKLLLPTSKVIKRLPTILPTEQFVKIVNYKKHLKHKYWLLLVFFLWPSC